MTNVEPLKALNLDVVEQDRFIKCYKRIPEKSTATVRFFQHTEFYAVYGDDALLAAEQVFNTNVVKYMGSKEPKLSYLCLSTNNFDKFVRDLLLVKQYRVEVYTNNNSQSKNNEWTLEYKGSPGNLQQFEAMLFDNQEIVINSCIMGIKIAKQNILGVACVNTTECIFHAIEFVDNEFYTELVSFIAQIGPKECILQSGESLELRNLRKMLERNNVAVFKAPKADYDANDIVQDLNRLLYFPPAQQRNALSLPETKLVEAMSSLQAIINYLNLINFEENFNQFKLTGLDVHNFVRLDAAAIYALNLLNKPGEVVHNKYDSVYGVLNSCSTPQGKRLLQRWLKQPISDIKILSERLNVVEALVDDSEIRNALSCCLNKISDLLLLAKKICNKKATLQDCYKVYQAVSYVPPFLATLRNLDTTSVNDLLIDPIAEDLNTLKNYQQMIEKSIDLDLVDRGEFLIRPAYDENLSDLYKRKQSVEEKMQKAFKAAANDLGFVYGKNMKLESTEQHGFFFRVTTKEEPFLRKNKSYKIIDVIKGSVRFTNDKLVQLNEDYVELKASYEMTQKGIVEEIFEVALGYTEVLRSLNMNIAIADVLVSFAISSSNCPIPYVRPKLLPMGSGVLKLKEARHPCLERQDGSNVIPNDVDFRAGDKMFYIVTGPNMGGKSTYMRTVGLSVLLAHIGCFVPCESAEISIVDCILARVGADDCELKGFSTFMMEMVETNNIIRSATSNSLVIIDELGRGTSTYDGCGIAMAIAEYLAQEIQAFTLFATHYHEITRLEERIQNVANLHVTAIIYTTTITPLYQVKEGVCDKSYGIHCARLVNFPEDVIQFAEQFQEELEDADGMKYIKDYDVTIKKNIVEKGDLLLAEGVNELKKISLVSKDEEVREQIKKIKMDLLSHENPFIKGLLGE